MFRYVIQLLQYVQNGRTIMAEEELARNDTGLIKHPTIQVA